MHDSKLVQLIKTFNRSEKEALKKWIHSPIHNQHEKCTELLNLLLLKRKLTARVLEKKQLFKTLYPDEPYNDKKLNHLINYGVKTVEEFIGFLGKENDKKTYLKQLIHYLDAHKLEKYAQQQLKKLHKLQENNPIHNSRYYYDQYQLEKLTFERENKSQRLKQTNLQEVFDYHYLAYVLDNLYYACEAITHQRLYKTVYEIPLLDAIIADLKAGKLKEVPAVQLYFYSYMSLKYPEEERHFLRLKELLDEHHAVLPRNELKNIYLSAINYCVQKLNSGIEKYVQTVFELYQYGLEHSILIEEKRLSHFTYRNIATAAIRLKEFNWVKDFIQIYSSYLEEKYQKNYALYVKAKLLFAENNYDECMKLLVKVDFNDIFLNMNAKVMLLKIYYEQNYIDALESLLSSFKRFLQRNKTIGYQKEIYVNMIYFTEKLITLPLRTSSKIAALRKEIEESHPLTERPWLLAQLDKL